MTKQKQNRDNDYYLERMKLERPDVFADYQKGKFKNASEAFVAAGLRKPKDGLKALQAAWKKATQAEQDAFKVFIGCGASAAGAAALSVTVGASVGISPIHVDRKLTPLAATAIMDIMHRRGMKMGEVMRELGFDALDASLGMALQRGTRLQPDLLATLEPWLLTNGATS
ncbi:hypothetical protein [Paracoccus ravus]|uniref:hypothetical protein n=1 Tax=Paracoccus ravus TaxID=2447760 RepID=UPI00106E84EA|nr:hypothetical protein [Paracoccus ravus]